MKKSSSTRSITAALLIAGGALTSVACPEDPNATLPAKTDAGLTGDGLPMISNPTGPIIGSPLSTFNTTVEGFMVEVFHDTNQVNLGDPASGASPPPALTHDSAEGTPEPGSLKVTAPYSGASQYVDIQKIFGATNPQNWAGKTLHVRIKLTQGSSTGGVQLYVKTTGAYVFGGSFTNFATGSSWQEFVLNVSSPMTVIAGYDPSQVVSFGLQLNSGSGGAASRPVTFHIDSFSVNPPVGAGGTTDDGGSGN